MAGNLVDSELSDLKHMVMSFRVSELQVLLGRAGRNKSGRKHDLLSRALQLLKAECTPPIRECIQELYQRRFPRSKNISLAAPSLRVNLNMDLGHSSSPIKTKNCKAPVHPDVTFKRLPFFDVLSDVIKPTSLITKSSADFTKVDLHFTLSEEQVRLLTESREQDLVKRYQVQLQLRFCLLETTCDQKDSLPPNLSLQINRQLVSLPPYIPPSKAGLEPKRLNRPIDISTGCRLSDVTQNRLEVSWNTTYGRNFALCVNVVRPLSADMLLQRLRKKGVKSSCHSQALINEKLARDPESEIATTSLKVSLLCPLGKMRMTVPARPITCTHMQCFDAMLFLQMNERKPSWTCPVCDKPAEFLQLFIDGLFVNILNETTSAEVIFLEDGRWEPFASKTECLSLVTPSRKSEMIEIVEHKCGKEPKKVNAGHGLKRGSKEHRGDLARGRFEGALNKCRKLFRSAKTLSTALDLSNSPKGSPLRNGDSRKRDPIIIDLTCDSSDEEDFVKSSLANKDLDEVHSLSSTSPYRSDCSLHRDDSLASPPVKLRRTQKDNLNWDTACGTSYGTFPPTMITNPSSSPRPLNLGHMEQSTEATSQTVQAPQPIFYPPITRSGGSPMSMYLGFDQYTNPLMDLNYCLNGYDPFRILPDGSARSSPFLGQHTLPPNADAVQRALYPGPYRLPPENSDFISID